jgi:class 3 adenylate cyclase/tetratricopeptide (TPR) repeat protein
VTETVQPPGARPGLSAIVRTFLIADVRGYTRYTLERGDEAAARLTGRFAEIVREVITARDGEVIELRGDEALVVFPSARQALRAAVELQARMVSESDPRLQVGVGLDAGEAVPVAGGFRGAALNLAARLCSLAGPGEVLASDTVANLARHLDDVEYVDRGATMLKGIDEPVKVIGIQHKAADIRSRARPGREDLRDGEIQRLPIGGFLGSLPSGPLVARERELEQILAVVRSVAGGEGRTVLLAGEPGAGKTRLAQEVTLHLRDGSFLIAAGRCYEPEASTPYYPFLDALAAVFAATAPEIRREVPHRWPYLGVLLPDQVGMQEVVAGGGQEEQRVFRVVTGFLEVIAEAGPIALLLDDLHWADGASLKLLSHLALHTRILPILILGTYRDVEVGRQHPLETVLRDLQRDGLEDRIDVRRLPKQGTSALIAVTMGEEEVSDEFTELVHGRTEGNPYFVQQVVRMLFEKGDVFKRDGVWDRRSIDEIELPESVRSVVGQRLSRLGETAQEVLREASVLGQTFLFDDLQEVSELPERALEAALDEARDAAIIREIGRDGYAFDHALTQQSLYAELSARRKRRLHRAVAEAIERLPESRRETRIAEVAWHFLQADDERALLWAVRAGDAAAALFAYGDAEWQYRTALELAHDASDEASEVMILEKLAYTIYLSSRFDEALTVLDAAWNLHQQLGDREGSLRVLAALGRVHARRGTPEEGIRRVLPSLEELQAADGIDSLSPAVGAGLYVAMAHLYFASGEYARLLAVSQEAIRLAEKAGDNRLLAEALNRKGVGLLHRRAYQDVIEACARAVTLAQEVGDLETAVSALNNVGVGYRSLGRLRDAKPWAERALQAQSQMGDPVRLSFMQMMLGDIHQKMGDWKEARGIFEAAVQAVRAADTSWYTPYPLANLGRFLLNEGDREQGLALLEEAFDLAAQSGDQQLGFFQYEVVEQEILDGEPAKALERIEPLSTLTARKGERHASALQAWAYLEMGDGVRAVETLRRAREQAASTGEKDALRECAWVGGLVATRARRWNEAEHQLKEAIKLAREMETPFSEAKALYAYGLMYTAKGDAERAREQLGEALRICRQLGAGQYTGLIERALTALEGSHE